MLKLTAKQAAFVKEYLVDLNQTQAAIRAGFSERTARTKASQLMDLPHVKAAIEAEMGKREERTEVTQDRVLQELARIGFSDIRKIFNENGNLKHPGEWDDETAAFVSSVEVVVRKVPGEEDEVEHIHKVKLWDKNSALEKIARHLGMLNDKMKVEHSGVDGAPLVPVLNVHIARS